MKGHDDPFIHILYYFLKINLYQCPDRRPVIQPGSYTLQEIADDFGAAKTTMQHHLTALRQAGIVRMKTSDYRYSLRSEVLDNLGELLGDYVKKTGDQP